MIKLDKNGTVYESDGKVRASLIADTKAEVEAMGNVADGVKDLADGTEITLGSTCLTATMEFGMMNTSGSWAWS